MKTAAIVDMYLGDAKNRRLSEKTVDGYGWALGKLVGAFPDRLPDDAEVLLRFLGDQELSEVSRHDLWRVTKTFWRWAAKKDLVSDIMCSVPAPLIRGQMPRTLTDDEVARALDATQSRRDVALLAVLLDTGIRLGELVTLKPGAIKPHVLVVSGKVGERVVPISSHIRDLLLEVGEGEHIWIGRRGPMTRSGVTLAIRRALRQANILPPKAGPHVLRHTFALHYIMRGGDVFSLQRIMGHQSVKTTMIYVYMSANDLVAQHSRYSPMADHRF